MTPSKRPAGAGLSFYRLLLIGLLGVTLTGCGTYGEPLFLARMYDAADPCQQNPYQSFCGASSGRTYIYTTPHWNAIGNQTGYIKK